MNTTIQATAAQSTIALHLLVLANRHYQDKNEEKPLMGFEHRCHALVRRALSKFVPNDVLNVMTYYRLHKPRTRLTQTGFNLATRVVEAVLNSTDLPVVPETFFSECTEQR